ncbi:MAG: aldo/keto reductase [Armatimonadota bacterium]
MNKVKFGNTGIEVPRLCIGTGTYGVGGRSSQADVSCEYYGIILARSIDFGMNFWDTSDDYGTHPHIAEALKTVKRDKVIIATKSHAQTGEDMRLGVEESLKELNTDYIDIMLMHEVDDMQDYMDRSSALSELHKFKKEGIIKAVGASTHSIDILEFLVNLSEIDVIMTNYNIDEDHMDAGIRDYDNALKVAHGNGKGIYVMKVLGEGRTAHKFEEAVKFALDKEFIHSACIGINKMEELEALREFAKLKIN